MGSPKNTTQLTPEQQELVTSNFRLSHYICKRLENLRPKTIDKEDWHSECLVALCLAARGYDPLRGAAFSTYAFSTAVKYLANKKKKESRAGKFVRQERLDADESYDRTEGLYQDDSLHHLENQELTERILDLASGYPSNKNYDARTYLTEFMNWNSVHKIPSSPGNRGLIHCLRRWIRLHMKDPR